MQRKNIQRNKLVFYLMLGMRDSNPRCKDQNLVPYRLANPQYCNFTLNKYYTKLF